jgi:DDE superfamily endonuclease
VDEKTSPRPRLRRQAAQPVQHGLPNRVKPEDRHAGRLNFLVAFDTRTGRVCSQYYGRKRQREAIALLEHLDAEIPAQHPILHLFCDNVRAHHSKQVKTCCSHTHGLSCTSRRCTAAYGSTRSSNGSPSAQVLVDRGLYLDSRPAGHVRAVHRLMECVGACLPMNHQVGGKSGG